MSGVDEVRRANIQALVHEFGSLKRLSEVLDRSESQVGQWKGGTAHSGTGKPRGMRSDTARYIESVTGKPAGWLDQPHASDADGSHRNVVPGPVIRGTYPLISEVQAGAWTELCDNFQPGDAEKWLPSTRNLGRCGYMLKVAGKSMENPGGRFHFQEGSILHVNPDMVPVPGQFVVVRRESTKEATFKRYVLIDGEQYLEAINPDWPKDKKYLRLQPGDAWCGVVVDASMGNLP